MVMHDWLLPGLLVVAVATALWLAHRGRALAAGVDRLERDLDVARASAADADGEIRAARTGTADAISARDEARGIADAARQSAESAAREATDLRQQLHSRDEFLATVVHELRTPLNAMIGWSHVLKANAADDVTRSKAIEAIIRNGERQARLISDLMDLSRVAAGKLRLEVQEDVELAPVIRGAVETVKPLAEAKAIRIRSTVDAEAGPIAADPHRVQQVAWNLLVNAVKFTPRGGTIGVEVAKADGDAVELRVTDDGPGIAQDLLPHIFDRFRQGAGSARSHGGLGLGLAIVRHLVELHGGAVSVNNNDPASGATFSVRLPKRAMASADHDSDVPAAETHDLPPLNGVTVLIVDRELEERDLVSDVLRGRGAEVLTANGADEALEMVRHRPPDFVLAEFGVPAEAGQPLISSIRALSGGEGGAVITVALSSRASDRISALLAGYQAHLCRPIDPVELVAVVATLAEVSTAPVEREEAASHGVLPV
jgi:signal transduction histidine kinase/CheY-like chemotaxis protein